jgi:tRNA-specific 2-thiouridylase
MSERTVVAMSGGVDSSVAAALMVERGHEAIGVTMSLAGDSSRCCGVADVDDARRVASDLGMRHFVANYGDSFRRSVQEVFADEYLAGRTPIPCVTCNTVFKFEYLIERARVFGAACVASGHYARIDDDPETGLKRLRTAADESKDQTYFLFELRQEQLSAVLFPLGNMVKSDVRAHARRLGLETAEKVESQEICFVPDGDYAAAVERIRPEALPGEGDIVDANGVVLGRHAGIHHFTIGQRRGLGLSSSKPLYVSSIDADHNRVVVGDREDLDSTVACVQRVSWVAGNAPGRALRARVKIRNGDPGVAAELQACEDGSVRVVFDEPARAVTPGQAAVFYDGDIVLGGGWIAGRVA